jgi:hypothetical protein
MLGNSGLSASLNSDYCLEAMRIFLSMDVQPDIARKKLINATIKRLIVNGVWQELDFLYCFAAHDEQAARLNWINPSGYSLSKVGAPVWASGQGYTGGPGKALNTNFTPSVNGIKYKRDNASYGVYVLTNVQESAVDMGCDDGVSQSRLVTRQATDTATARINSAAINANNTSATNSQGFHSVIRTTASNMFLFRNGSQVAANATVSTGIPSRELYVLASNTSGVLSQPSSKKISLAFAGSSNINQQLIYQSIQQLMTDLGINV